LRECKNDCIYKIHGAFEFLANMQERFFSNFNDKLAH